jgi:hypothetical protein
MLPFTRNDKRQYTCFVCGVSFNSFNEFNEHIIETHEEGREYIKCPLERCGACVRDVRQHFKAKHKTEVIPKCGQLKATIWKDQNSKTGQMKQRKPKFREGYMYSVKNGKEVHYRSGMECEVYECLEAMQEVISYEVEPFKVNYSFQGTMHEYNPDLQIFFQDGRIEIWEIKPSNQTSLPKNNAKWGACQYFCETRGYKFMVLTEVGMQKLKKGISL